MGDKWQLKSLFLTFFCLYRPEAPGQSCITPDRGQSKTLLTIDEHRSKIARISVFDCHLSPVGRQMAIKNSVSNDFGSMFIDSSNVFVCRLSDVCIVV